MTVFTVQPGWEINVFAHQTLWLLNGVANFISPYYFIKYFFKSDVWKNLLDKLN